MRTQQLALPPSEVRGLIAKLVPKIQEVEKMRAQVATAHRAEETARREIDQVAARDRQALADHARGKVKSKPKPALPAAREAFDEASAKSEVLALAAADAERELTEAINEHCAEYEGQVACARERASEAMREQAAKLTEMEGERRQIAALADWLRSPTRFAPEKFSGRPLDLKRPGGEPYSLEDVVAALVDSLTVVEAVPSKAEAKEEFAA